INIIGVWINFRDKNWNIPMLLQIIYLGNILFLSFWETKARYALGATPVILFITAYSVLRICEKLFISVRTDDRIKIKV
ncbi:MAG: hypothetical protein IJD80_04735, partial [Oscillospiraceae bacterium]|nr:hypothetical protein [Oscillospiraceae bacterium]